jgi:hypothetical protein
MFEARLSKLGVGPKSNDWNNYGMTILNKIIMIEKETRL